MIEKHEIPRTLPEMVWIAIILLVGLFYLSFWHPDRKSEIEFDRIVKLVVAAVIALGASSAWLKFLRPGDQDLVGWSAFAELIATVCLGLAILDFFGLRKK